MPVYFIHFVTNRCNANCEHCFVDKKDFNNELSLDEIRRMSKTMGNNLYNVLLTGGEPFIRKDLFEIVHNYFHNTKTESIQIPTNGLLTDHIVKTAKEILKDNPNKQLGVNLSMDGIGRDHDKIRGVKGMFKRMIKTYNELFILEEENDNFNLNINVTVSHYNQDKLVSIYKYLINELKAKNIFNSLIRGNPQNPIAKKVDLKKYEYFNHLLENGLKNKELSGYSKFFLSNVINAQNIVSRKNIVKIAKHNKYVQPCYAGSLLGVIYSRGDVYPCELLNKKIGNIRDYNYDFRKLWLNNRTKKIREYIKNNKCFCTHECFMTVNTLFNPQLLPNVFKEFLRVKKWKLY